jgi:hypothetical protein
VQSCLSNVGDIEVIVQDCSDTRELKSMLDEQVNDSRVKYFHSAGSPSMTENWNSGMEKATGEYVIVIGDDDAVSRDLIETARWARSQGVDSLAFSPYRYYWPDYPGQYAGQLIIYRINGSLRAFDVNTEVERASHKSGECVKQLPKLYHGLIRRELLERLRERTGVYFDSFAPDYYIRYALLDYVTTHYRLDYPVVTVGCSGPSNSARTKIRDLQAHIDEFRDTHWPSILPPVSAKESIVLMAASMIRALQRIDRDDLASNVDLATVYAACMVTNPRQLGPLARQYVSSARELGRALPISLARLAFSLTRRLSNAVRYPRLMPDTPSRRVARVVAAVSVLQAQKERDVYVAQSTASLSELLDASASVTEAAHWATH